MMLSSKRVLKPEMVTIDDEIKIIEINSEIFEEEKIDEPVNKEKDAQSAAKKIIRDAEKQAEEILGEAKKNAAEDAAKIRKEAEENVSKILSEARENGYNEGIEKANREGEEIKNCAQKILDDATAEQKKMRDELEPEIVNMIIAITEKLLGNISAINPAIITNLVKQGFAASAVSGDIIVHVSAADYDLVLEKKDEILASSDGSVKLQITKDLSLSPMDCVIETPMGVIDCSLGQQFETLKSNLIYILNNK